ncbi:MAG: GTP 3',8-cyclase MoaA [Methylococcales bacterium]|jgi:GTP 3',8-cyclase|nr:GTP 3',8-cyclase MoaA [Methylococcales bacterium]MBT7408377.1 GTP 3',8-cyclase MoaA [Methylococcales bacterium]
MNQLIDRHKRVIKYLRLSVTDKCDLRCFYCMPKNFKDFEIPEHWLNFDEITQIVRVFSSLGVSSVRLTGGEPLTRRNLPSLISQLNQIPGIDDFSLSTNALQLRKQAVELKNAGITRTNISLDSLDPVRFKEITNGPLEKVLDGIMAAKKAGLNPIKINMVVMKGVNHDEVDNMVRYCVENQFILRFIETMPMGNSGREASNHYIDINTIKKQLTQKFDLVPGIVPGSGPARYMKVAGTESHIGFITPISQHFCDTCNRVRLGVEGVLYMCLGQEHSINLRPFVRNGIDDSELAKIIKNAINMKPLKHDFNDNPDNVNRIMSMTGG